MTIVSLRAALILWLVCAAGILAGEFDRVNRAPINLPTSLAYEDYEAPVLFPTLPPLLITAMKYPRGDTNRLFVLHKPGVIYVITNLSAPTLTTFLDLTGVVDDDSERGLLGLAFHPGYTSNGLFYVFYSRLEKTSAATNTYERVARFRVDPRNPNRAQPESEAPLISQYDENFWHQGGDLEFGPDGYLYVSVGDEGGFFNSYDNAQRIDKDFFSGILRIDVDRRPGNLPPTSHPAIHPGSYLVPADNPFLNAANWPPKELVGPPDPTRIRTEFYAIGLRNPSRMYFDSLTGELFANDTGQNLSEEVDQIVAGGNYGWNFVEGSNELLPVPSVNNFRKPLLEYNHDRGLAIIDGMVYRGTTYPELSGSFVFTDYTGWIGSFKRLADGTPTPVQWIAWVPTGTALAVHPQTGEILVNGYASWDGRIHVLRRRAPDPSRTPPNKLSQTGLFADLATLKPAAGFAPYAVAVPFWSDYAEKYRWVSLAATTSTIQILSGNQWNYPVGSIWMKHFDLPLGDGPDAVRRRLETRVLYLGTQGMYGLTYRWDADQRDATLIPDSGADELIEVERDGVRRNQKWRFPGRRECLECHNPNANYVLGFTVEQLNTDMLINGQPTNQLAQFSNAGWFDSHISDIHTLPRLARLDDETWSVEGRMRSYLAVNCAYCNQPGGVNRAKWDGRLSTVLANTQLNNVPAELSIDFTRDPRVIAPGDLDRSMLYHRVANLGSSHMPPLGTAELNQPAIALLARWITNDLPVRPVYSNWATNYFPDPTVAAAQPAADPDADGESNQAEFLRGTSPLEYSTYGLLRAEVDEDGVVLRFHRTANRWFNIEWETGLRQRWHPLDAPGSEPKLSAEDETVEIHLPAEGTVRFYRLNLAEP